MEKIMITLEDGTKADVDKKAFENMKQAIIDGKPKKIVQYSVQCLMSSDKMMDDLVNKISEGIEKILSGKLDGRGN